MAENIRRLFGRSKAAPKDDVPLVEPEKPWYKNKWWRVVDENPHASARISTMQMNHAGDLFSMRGNLRGASELYHKIQNPEVRNYIDAVGWSQLFIPPIPNSDNKLVEALIARWWDTTHTFHLPMLEIGLTPFDFVALSGISVGQGDPLPEFPTTYVRNPEQIIEEYFPGYYHLIPKIEGRNITAAWVKKYLLEWCSNEANGIPNDASPEQIARIFLLFVIGYVFFPTGNDRIYIDWLEILNDMNRIRTYDWGSSILARIYMALDKNCRGVVTTVNCFWQVTHHRLWHDYFAKECVYNDEIFRRRFRMKRQLFDRIFHAVIQHDDYFVQKVDAVGKMGLSSLQKIVAALRMLAYGAAADVFDEYLRIGETTTIQAVKRFAYAVVRVFHQQYCRSPTAEDVQRIQEQNSQRGFPGMIGSIDCMHWGWKNCPHAWKGQYTGHAHAATIILEAVASYDTWIWHSFFGMPGACNDLNVLHRSTVFEDLLKGNTTPIHFEINGNHYDMGYYLADGIYPPLATIVKSFKKPLTQKQSLFAQAQEGARKDVERAFGILQQRFAFIKNPARFWNFKDLSVIMKACIILHNMIVENELRDENWGADTDVYDSIPTVSRESLQEYYEYKRRETQLHDRVKHNQLRDDLVDHIWSMYGDN